MRQRQAGAVHFPGPLYKVMGLIDKKKYSFPLYLQKSVSDKHMDQRHNCNHRSHCQARLPRPATFQKGTHLYFRHKLPSPLRSRHSRDDHDQKRPVHPVIMPSGPGALHWVAPGFIKIQHFSFRRQCNVFKIRPFRVFSQKAVQGFLATVRVIVWRSGKKSCRSAPRPWPSTRREHGRSRFSPYQWVPV